MEELVILPWFIILTDSFYITITDDVFVLKIIHNGIGIDFFNELIPKLLENLLN